MTEMKDDQDSVRKALFAMSPEKYSSWPSTSCDENWKSLYGNSGYVRGV